jgi:hypothetical protein
MARYVHWKFESATRVGLAERILVYTAVYDNYAETVTQLYMV